MASPRDDFHTPTPKKAPAKSVVSAVLGKVSLLGTSLLSLLSGLLAAALIMYSGYVLYDTFYTQESAKSSWDLLQYKPIIEDAPGPKDQEGENKLAAINSDYRAWLTLYDTNIDYPVMQGENDLYYANHDIYKDVSLTGAIYLAAGNKANVSDSYNLIYGHHMDNGAMFGGLDRYGIKDSVTQEIVSVDMAYFDAHREGLLVARSAVYDLYAFAFVKTDAYQNRIYSVGERMDDVLTFLRANTEGADTSDAYWSSDTTTLYLDEAPLVGATKIVALSTCADAVTNGRLVVLYTAKIRNLITVYAEGNTWTYDGQPHTLKDLSDDGTHQYVVTNIPEDSEHPTLVEYSIDGGTTWTTEPPTVTNVSENTTVIVRVTNDLYGRATTEVQLQTNRKEVSVVADAGQHKTYGQGDPVLTATPVGLVGNDTLTYAVTRPGAGEAKNEKAGSYPNAVVPSGEQIQGNYIVTYVPADFTIQPATGLKVTATGYTGTYDGETHRVTATTNVINGTTIEYSTDGGRTWTTTPPKATNVSESIDRVWVRATNPNYHDSAIVRVPLKVDYKDVTVRADRGQHKTYGQNDPTLTATAVGLIGSDTVQYQVTRPRKDIDEAAGTYNNAVVPAGDVLQGNYRVTYEPAEFTIRPATLQVNVTGYTGEYDGRTHPATVTVNVTEGTVVEYSTDGGRTWTTTVPTIRDVDEIKVLVRVTNPNYVTYTGSTTLKATAKPVTVKAEPASKPFGARDPQSFNATVTGLVGNDTIAYTVNRTGVGTQAGESVGVHRNAIVPSGDKAQGNYEVTYEPADFTITTSDQIHLNVTDITAVYDGKPHVLPISVSIEDGTVIEYSTDGGRTWTVLDGTHQPSLTDVGTQPVVIRATNPDHGQTTATGTIRVIPKSVMVAAHNSSKTYGEEEPVFEATVTGLIGDDTVEYTVSRPDADRQQDVGTYRGAIVANGEREQGNYVVTYIPGDFEITPAVLPLQVKGYIGVYDGQQHSLQVDMTSLPNGGRDTVIQYSTDGGRTWTSELPTIRDVGEETVLVRATAPNYAAAEAEVQLKVIPKSVMVAAHNSVKTYGEEEPVFEATVTGLIGDDTVEYTISRPDADQQQNVGTYLGAIVANGEREQGNYVVTYIPGDFEIVPAILSLQAQGYTGVYDGQEHQVKVDMSSLPNGGKGTVIEYSTDGGRTWTSEPPAIRDVGEQKVLVRATNPDYETEETEVLLKITPRQVIVTADNQSKLFGNDDPVFTATVEGLLEGDTIEYTITCEESDDLNSRLIKVEGAEVQGNYIVKYYDGTLRIVNNPAKPTPTPTAPGTTPGPNATNDPNGGTIDIEEPEDLDDTEPPLARIMKVFEPKGTRAGRAVWALVNLICLIITIYLFIPLMHLSAKFDRPRLMKKINANKRQLRILKELSEEETRDKTRLEQLVQEARRKLAEAKKKSEFGDELEEDEFDTAVEELFYKVKRFLRRFRWGLFLELIFAVLAVIAFLLTEDMRLPMVLIDRWTPLMIVLMFIVWLLDVRLIRYREKVLADEEEAERRRQEREAAAQ